MIIPASRFLTLPEGCTVLWGSSRWDSATVQFGGSIALRRQGRKGVHTRVVSPDQVQADLSTPAAVRAFAPALICAVVGAESPPKHPPAVVLDDDYGEYTLIESIGYCDGLEAARYMPGGKGIYAATPEACLLAGLQAALDAAKDTP